jgi:O-antigen/teichoic acid export membrane protein
LFPEAARSKAADAEVAFVWARATAVSFGLVSVGVGIVVAERDWVMELLLGSKFAEAADAFGVLMVGFSLVVLGYSCAVILNARGDFVLQRNCYGWTAVAMALLAWPFTRFGILGAAALYSISRLVDVVLMYFTARKVGALSTVPTMLMTLLSHGGLMSSAWNRAYLPALACSLGLAWMLRRWVRTLRSREMV